MEWSGRWYHLTVEWSDRWYHPTVEWSGRWSRTRWLKTYMSGDCSLFDDLFRVKSAVVLSECSNASDKYFADHDH